MNKFTQVQKYMILVSKSQIKLITSLHQKKYRDKLGLFVAEGPKVIKELLDAGIKLHSLFSTENFTGITQNFYIVTKREINKISYLKTANTSLAVFEIPSQRPISEKGIIVALDAVRDPGNLGTIIRICDWFGVTQLVCSLDTVDFYNPKVVQASMGSNSRVNVLYVSLREYIEKSSLPIYGGCLEGESVFSQSLPKDVVIVLGNEANGISKEINSLLTKKITIPQFGDQQKTESLNVATAAAIIISEFKRK